MANPLKSVPPSGPTGPSDEFSLKLRCHDLNFNYRRMQDDRWHYVEPASKEHDARIMIVSGIQGEEVWKMHEGQRLDYKGWDRERLDKAERRARWLLKQGMVPPSQMAA